jgi:NAD(P)-dependent dehydrogenase (short-subunit alcohol dehydrogenase family)
MAAGDLDEAARRVDADGGRALLGAAYDGTRPPGPAAVPDFSALTGQVLASFAATPDPRVRTLVTDLVRVLHDYTNRNDLTQQEWEYAVDFLTRTGQLCSPTRQEFVLLSDTLGVSSMVDLLGLPQNASYALTKGAVRAFSESLRNELVNTDIGVTTVFPGAIRTNITNGARGSQSSRLADMGRSRMAPLVMRPPSAVAKRIVTAIEADRGRVVVGPDAHLVSVWSRIAPGRARSIGRVTARLIRT